MRLSTRIYLLAVLTILAAGVAVAAIGVLIDLPVMLPPFGRFMVAEILASGDEPEVMQATLARVQSNSAAQFTVYDAQDRLIASNVDPPHLPLTDSERSRLAAEQEFVRGHPPSAVVAIVQDGAVAGYGQFTLPSLLPLVQRLFLPLGLFLTCLMLTSALLARSLARPITHLVGVVRDFGAGDHEARAHLDRRDEIGQLGEAFDEMADRTAALVRAQHELLANVSHELRTPMARIRVALDIAALGDADQTRAELAEMGEDLGELERLVSDVLVTARLGLGDTMVGHAALPLRVEPVEAALIVDAAAERFERRHPTHRLEKNIAGQLPAIDADPMMLRRVIDNLLDNAVHASDTGSPVELRAFQDADRLVVEVSDEGIGIDDADLEKVFRPFFRADRSRTRDTGGTGLGLALSRRIVEAHGGTITIESERDRGTTVRFSLPTRR